MCIGCVCPTEGAEEGEGSLIRQLTQTRKQSSFYHGKTGSLDSTQRHTWRDLPLACAGRRAAAGCVPHPPPTTHTPHRPRSSPPLYGYTTAAPDDTEIKGTRRTRELRAIIPHHQHKRNGNRDRMRIKGQTQGQMTDSTHKTLDRRRLDEVLNMRLTSSTVARVAAVGSSPRAFISLYSPHAVSQSASTSASSSSPASPQHDSSAAEVT